MRSGCYAVIIRHLLQPARYTHPFYSMLVHSWMGQDTFKVTEPDTVAKPETEQYHSEGRYCLPGNISLTVTYRTSSEVEARPSKVTVPPTRVETVTSQIPARRGACSHVSGFESGSCNKLGSLRILVV